MGNLKSELTWSFSRSRLFSECRRAYYFNYYASWGGWNASADEFIRKAYILKNMQNIDAWVGDIVHGVIKWILDNKRNGKNITFEEANNKTKIQFTKTWEQSRSRAWINDIKHNLNLFEHYYQREPSPDELTAKLAKAANSIKGFYSSGLFEKISALPAENFLSVDTLDSFEFNGIKVFAVPDFAVRDNGYVLYDWKTGKPSPKDILQMSCYILYAVAKWKVSLEDIRIIPVYLTGDNFSFFPITPVSPKEVTDYITSSIDAMKSVLSSFSDNKIEVSKCPRTEDKWRCHNCKFQEICRSDQPDNDLAPENVKYTQQLLF